MFKLINSEGRVEEIIKGKKEEEEKIKRRIYFK